MRHYEIVLLIHPDQSEQAPAMLERYREMVTADKGRIHRVEDWGRRRLAYMINEVHKAHYLMLNIECNLETLRELEKNFKFNDSILRNLVVRRTQALTEQSPLAKAKAEEDRLEAEKAAKAEKAAQAAALAAQQQAAEEEKAPPETAEAHPEGDEVEVAEGEGDKDDAGAEDTEGAEIEDTEGAEAAKDADSVSDSQPAEPVAEKTDPDAEAVADQTDEDADQVQTKQQPETV